jgi:hypothetical protein
MITVRRCKTVASNFVGNNGIEHRVRINSELTETLLLFVIKNFLGDKSRREIIFVISLQTAFCELKINVQKEMHLCI